LRICIFYNCIFCKDRLFLFICKKISISFYYKSSCEENYKKEISIILCIYNSNMATQLLFEYTLSLSFLLMIEYIFDWIPIPTAQTNPKSIIFVWISFHTVYKRLRFFFISHVLVTTEGSTGMSSTKSGSLLYFSTNTTVEPLSSRFFLKQSPMLVCNSLYQWRQVCHSPTAR